MIRSRHMPKSRRRFTSGQRSPAASPVAEPPASQVPAPSVARVFLSYKQAVEPDVAFTHMLAKTLSAAGCEVVWDQEILPTHDWREQLEGYIQGSDLFLLVLTHSSAHSPFVQTELEYAYKAAQRDHRHPRIAAIRVAYQTEPPMDVRAMLRNGQNLEWNIEEDTLRLLERLFALLRAEGYLVETEAGKQAAHGLFVSQETPLARDLRAAMVPFVAGLQVKPEALDEALFLAVELDFLYKGLLLHIPPEKVDGTTVEAEDEHFRGFRMQVAVLSRYAASTGKPLRFQEFFLDLMNLADKHLEVTGKQRDLGRAGQLAVNKEQQNVHKKQMEDAKHGITLSQAPAKFIGNVNESLAAAEQVEIGYRAQRRALREEFSRHFDEAYASTLIKLRELAKLYRWDDSEWCFDAQSAPWREIRQLTFQRRFEERVRALRVQLDRHPNNFGMIAFYLYNVTATQDRDNEFRLHAAARATLMVPGAYIFDEERQTLGIAVAESATDILRASESNRLLGTNRIVFAQQVHRLLEVFETHNPDFMGPVRVEAQVIALAASGRLEDAFALADARLRVEPNESWLFYIMARLASRLNRFDDALVWLKRSMRYRVVQASTYSVEPDLENLRKARSADFQRLTALNCQVVCDNGLAFYDVVLTNRSGFTLNDPRIIVDLPSGGSKTLSFSGSVPHGTTKKWGWIGKVSSSFTTVPLQFYLQCAQGETSG